jgi:hypothetical protein
MWRNWQTRRLQVPVGLTLVEVRLLSSAFNKADVDYNTHILIAYFSTTYKALNEIVIAKPINISSAKDAQNVKLIYWDFMLEFFQNLQTESMSFYRVLLIVPGLVLLLSGLVIWLAGSAFIKSLMSFFCAAVGAIIIALFLSKATTLILIGALAGAIFGLLFRRFSIALFLSFYVVAVLFFVTADSSTFTVEDSRTVLTVYQSQEKTALTFNETMDEIKLYSNEFFKMLTAGVKQISKKAAIIITAGALGVFATGIIFLKIARSLFCSFLGSVLIFAGLVILLMYKGSYPIARISERPLIFLAGLGIMICFGTMEQLILCPRIGKKSAPKKRRGNQEEAHEILRRTWWTT